MATITTEQGLRDAIAASDPVLNVTNNITLTLPNTINYNAALTANNSVLTWNGASNAMMFSVVDGATVTLENIVLEANGSFVTLASVQASTLVMNDGAILRNSQTIASVPALAIGISTDLGVGGTFLMNGGLITGVRNNAVVGCWGGTIRMSGNAAISQNMAYGVYLQEGTLDMTGNARISENAAALPAMGVRATEKSVINMGLATGDAPQISDNRSTNNSVGGVWLEGESILNMNHEASISGNTAFNMAGGVRLDGSTLNMLGNAKISGNTAQGGACGGVAANAGSQVTMAGNASIFDNQTTAANGQGGGVYLLPGTIGSTLTMRGDASIYGNSATRGGGLFISNNNSLVMGVNAADTPSITGNRVTANGGGIYIGFFGAAAELSAQSRTAGNTAVTAGNGIYNAGGTLRISQNIQIADGLYFESEETAPVIVQGLGENASIQLENNSYIDPADIPVVVAVKGDVYEALTETDRVAFRAPATFPPGIAAYLNADRNQVLLGFVVEIEGAFLSIVRIA